MDELRNKAIEERNRLKTLLEYKQIKLKQIQEQSRTKEEKTLIAKVNQRLTMSFPIEYIKNKISIHINLESKCSSHTTLA